MKVQLLKTADGQRQFQCLMTEDDVMHLTRLTVAGIMAMTSNPILEIHVALLLGEMLSDETMQNPAVKDKVDRLTTMHPASRFLFDSLALLRNDLKETQ